MRKQLIEKKCKLALVGLGYVGLPIALEFAKKISVIGFDINEARLEQMRKGVDPSKELDSASFQHVDIEFTSSIDKLREARFFIIAVPTPITESNEPNLTPILSATRTIGKALKKGDIVVYESTVYPGCTEEDCIPVLEQVSGLRFGEDFKVGYSPERINPGDKVHTLTTTQKIVSGCDEETLNHIAEVYELIIKAGVYRASSIKVAEAAKIIENTQRDVNIALMNELSIIFSRIGINTLEVIEAAGTKWNFLKFYPGLVGGHCIGVDPYYLVHKAHLLKYHPKLINAGRFVNDSMGGYIAKQLVKQLAHLGTSSLQAKVLVMGITFKENVSDIRNSKVVDIIKELRDYGVKVEVVDPMVNTADVKREYGIEMNEKLGKDYDAVVVAVAHNAYKTLSPEFFSEITKPQSVLVDVKGLYRGKVPKMIYWSM